MATNKENPICVHCKEPVVVCRDFYAVQEKMHWICFHLNFEHEGDPDEDCGDPSCPMGDVKRLNWLEKDPQRLRDLYWSLQNEDEDLRSAVDKLIEFQSKRGE